jgi:hypothetical protein
MGNPGQKGLACSSKFLALGHCQTNQSTWIFKITYAREGVTGQNIEPHISSSEVRSFGRFARDNALANQMSLFVALHGSLEKVRYGLHSRLQIQDIFQLAQTTHPYGLPSGIATKNKVAKKRRRGF